MVLIVYLLLLAASNAINPLPGQIWDSELIDLGNGGDATFYALIKCKTCQSPPLVIWFAGGPGSSSTPRMFIESGPLLFNTTCHLNENPFTWAKLVDIMYVDNPVGVPFSKAKNNSTYCTTEKCVVKNLFFFFLRFLERHPEYKHRPLYLAGISYAGHYVPAFAAHLTRINHPDINFIAAGVGNGMINFYQQDLKYSDYLYSNHNISALFYIMMKASEIVCGIARISQVTFFDTFCIYGRSKFLNLAGIKNPYDIVMQNTTELDTIRKCIVKYMNNSDVKKAFGVEGQVFSFTSEIVSLYMKNDVSLPMSEDIAYVLDKGKKMIFWFGDNDYQDNWMGGLNVLENVDWKGATEFKKSEEKPWGNSKGKVFGTTRNYKELTYFKVFNSGHISFDRQKEATYYLLEELLKP